MPLTIVHGTQSLTAPLAVLRACADSNSDLAHLIPNEVSLDRCSVRLDDGPTAIYGPTVVSETTPTVVVPGGGHPGTVLQAALDALAAHGITAPAPGAEAVLTPASFMMLWPCAHGSHPHHIERNVGAGHPDAIYATTVTFPR